MNENFEWNPCNMFRNNQCHRLRTDDRWLLISWAPLVATRPAELRKHGANEDENLKNSWHHAHPIYGNIEQTNHTGLANTIEEYFIGGAWLSVNRSNWHWLPDLWLLCPTFYKNCPLNIMIIYIFINIC